MVNPLQFTQPQAYSGGADFSPLERLGYHLAEQRQKAAEEADAYRLMGGGQGQPQGMGLLSELGRTLGLSPGTPPTTAAVGPTPTGSVAGSGIGTMTPNARSWFDFAIRPVADGGLGLTQAQAAGKVANLQAESGPAIPPWGATGDQGTAQGSAQWRGDRLRNLVEFSRANGLDYRTTEAQQAFMRHEYIGDPSQGAGGGSERKAYSALSATSSPQEAASAVNRYYERSADKSGRREAGAARFAGAPVMARGGATEDRFAAPSPLDTAQYPAGPEGGPSPLDTAQYPAGPVGTPATDFSSQQRNFTPQAAPLAPLEARNVPAAPEARVAQNLISGQPAAAAGVGREQLAQMYRNPITRPLATAILQKQMDPGTWTYQQVGDRLIAANSRTGETKVVMEDTKPLVVGNQAFIRDPNSPTGFRDIVQQKPIQVDEDKRLVGQNAAGQWVDLMPEGGGGGKIKREIGQRTQEALDKGYPQDVADYYGLNGKLPKEDMTSTEIKTLSDNQKQITSGQNVLDTVGQMKELSPKAWSGMLAEERAVLAGKLLPDAILRKFVPGAANTETLSNLALQNVAGQAKAMFGARLALGEVQLLQKIETTPNMSRATREQIYPQVERIINNHMKAAEAENEAIRNKTYKKPGGSPSLPRAGTPIQASGGAPDIKWSIVPQ